MLSGFFAIESQLIIFSGGTYASSNLYPDSYISYNFTPIVQNATPNEIEVTVESPKFTSCNSQVYIPAGIKVIDAKIVSYSGIHWTDFLSVNGDDVYDLSRYNSQYIRLGDPFIVQIPPTYINLGELNYFSLKTGDDSSVNTNCSSNNSFIYTALVPSSTSRSEVVAKKIGCNWTIQFEDDTFSTKTIPSDCSGASPCPRCSYTAINHTLASGAYDPEDAYDIGVFNLLRDLDFDDNGKIFVNLDASNIEIVITTVSSVPYLWGPTLVEVRTWQ